MGRWGPSAHPGVLLDRCDRSLRGSGSNRSVRMVVGPDLEGQAGRDGRDSSPGDWVVGGPEQSKAW